MMLFLNGYPIIEWVVRRVKQSRLINDMVVGIPDKKEDDILAAHLEKLNVDIYRGSEEDVLQRLFRAAKVKKASQVVRVCADNPLICGNEIDNLVSFFKENPCDYAYNHLPKNNLYPNGLGAEILSFEQFEYIERIATDKEHREHVLTYIWDHQKNFTIKTFDPPNKKIHHPELILDIDTIDDYRKLALTDVAIDSTAEQIIDLFQNKP